MTTSAEGQRDLVTTPAGRSGASPLAHACDPAPPGDASGTPATAGRRSGSRLIGIDAARGVALLGMMAVHVMDPVAADGNNPSLTWTLAAGKSAALFALLAGVGVAFASGRREQPHGRLWAANASSLVVRALLIGAVGLTLGAVVPRNLAGVILPYYALLFLLAIPLLSLSVRALVLVAGAIVLGMPVLSHVLRSGSERVTAPNTTFGQLASDPVGVLTELALTGTYPALPWLAYLCVGLAVGRAALSSRRTAVTLALAGTALAVAAQVTSWVLLDVLGGRADLEEVALQSLTQEQYTDLLAWGPAGTTPSDTGWWLATVAPHSSTPLDLLFTIGVGLAVLGVCLLLGRMTTGLLRPLAVAGSMTLTLYSLHLLLLSSPFMPDDDLASLLLQVLVLVAFAFAWSRAHARGPLEDIVARATGAVRRRVLAGRREKAGAAA
ncbi:heparan-alpha-glucosaminide N-acetyltransferase domain-containing protein [Geodermatophilus sp. SYSU D00710]